MQEKQKINPKNYEAIVFDLGGVILNLDYQLTLNAFINLGIMEASVWDFQREQESLFNEYEIGAISSQRFINSLLPYCKKGTTANEVVFAWNAMILDFPLSRMNWLEEFGKKNNIFLLSNTNELHLQRVNRKLKEAVGKETLDFYFKQCFYSHILNARKPLKSTFIHICEELGLNPGKILFVDDTAQHISGAEKAGMRVRLIDKNEEISQLFS